MSTGQAGTRAADRSCVLLSGSTGSELDQDFEAPQSFALLGDSSPLLHCCIFLSSASPGGWDVHSELGIQITEKREKGIGIQS